MFTNWKESNAPAHLLEPDSIPNLITRCIDILECMYNNPKMTWRNLFNVHIDEVEKAWNVVCEVFSQVTWALHVVFVRKDGEILDFGAGIRDKDQKEEWKSLDVHDVIALLNSLRTAPVAQDSATLIHANVQ